MNVADGKEDSWLQKSCSFVRFSSSSLSPQLISDLFAFLRTWWLVASAEAGGLH